MRFTAYNKNPDNNNVGRGSWGEVAQALEDGYAVNATNGYGDSILTAAARVGHLTTMALALGLTDNDCHLFFSGQWPRPSHIRFRCTPS